MNKRVLSYTMLISSVSLLGLSFSAASAKDSKPMALTAAAPKIAVIDVRRIMSQDTQLLKEESAVSHEWRDQFEKLQETLKPINEEIQKLQKEYQEKMKELESLQKSGVSSNEALQKKYQEEVAPLEYRLQTQSQQTQQFATNELMRIQQILAPKVEKAIETVTKAQGWDLVISRDAVVSPISTDSRFNVTSHVLYELNEAYAKEKAAADKKA